MSRRELSISAAGWIALMGATLLLVVNVELGELVAVLAWAIAAIVIGIAQISHWSVWWRGRFGSPRVNTTYLVWLIIESGWALLVLAVTCFRIVDASQLS